MCVLSPQAYELRGVSKLDEANVCPLVWCFYILGQLNLMSPEAKSIMERLRSIPRTLRYVLDHPLDGVKSLGQTTAAFCSVRATAFPITKGVPISVH